MDRENSTKSLQKNAIHDNQLLRSLHSDKNNLNILYNRIIELCMVHDSNSKIGENAFFRQVKGWLSTVCYLTLNK